MSATSFNDTLHTGLIGESLIARWLNARRWNVLPAYQVEVDNGKGPRFYTATAGALVTPDMLAIRDGQVWWVEAKTKSAFTWHRLTETWQTGIDRRHWLEYLKVREITPFPIWLLFLHRPDKAAKDTPSGKISPSGLYGQEIGYLCEHVDHEHENHGPTGMVYWQEQSLTKIATYREVVDAAQNFLPKILTAG